MGKWLSVLLLVLALAAGAIALWLRSANDYQTEGTIELAMLSAPVTVTRDRHGIAHIAAENRRDMLRAQGFITAQDRLFQLEFFKMLAEGRLAELIGEAGLQSDKNMRVLGLTGNGARMAAQLAPDVRQFLGDYLDGVNAYIATREDEFPLELSLIDHTPKPWTMDDAGLILQYISLQHSVNMRAEAVLQALVDTVGAEKAATLAPINVNPDREPPALPARFDTAPAEPSAPSALTDLAVTSAEAPQMHLRDSYAAPAALHERLAPLHVGSNNWAVGPRRSASGEAMVVNDPHLDSRLLPGVWYPVGLSAGDFHAAGVALPGLPGIVIGRTRHVAFGVTNAYGDVQDLFIEQIDPTSEAHYLEGDVRVPFEVREEVIRVRDGDAPGGFREETLTVRSTRRGPIVSDHGMVDLGDRLVSLRWGAASAFRSEIGFDNLLYARSAAEVDVALKQIDIHMFNFVFADVDGHFGRRSTGRIPIRRQGQGLLPTQVTDSAPMWTDWIPKDEMPFEFDPARGWTGTANNDTRPTAYPYTYSTYFAPAYRYRRMAQLLDGNAKSTAEDHWAYMHDVKNLQAAEMAPQLVPLLREAGFDDMADTLAAWSHADEPEERAPLVYQALYQELARATFEDELGDSLTPELLGNWYLWQERFDALVREGASAWFDDVRTNDRVEGLADVVARAAERARGRLDAFGPNATWGDAHTLTFRSPLRQSGPGSDWVGGGTYPMSGSGETVRRARYSFNAPFDAAFFASFMLVSDMGERDEILTALPGGVAARMLHDHYTDRIPAWHAGTPTATPLTREMAQAAAVSTLTLAPAP